MSKEILISVEPQQTSVALTNQGRLDEFYVERPQNKTIVGNIYKMDFYINFISYFKDVQNKLKHVILNAIICCSIITLIGVLKLKDLKEIFSPLFASFVSSLIIIIYTKYKKRLSKQ